MATNTWGSFDLEDIRIDVPSPLDDIWVMSPPAADPWGFDLEDIQIDVPSPLTDIQVMAPPAADPWGGMDLEDIRIDVASPPIVVTSPNASDIQVSLPVNHMSGDMHLMDIQVDNPPPPVACDMDLEDIRLDVYSADVAASGLSYLEMDLDKASLNVHISDYLIQNLHPQRYLSHLQVLILKPPDLQHQQIWMKEARG